MSVDSLPQKIKVVAYSGYKANERPLYFIFNQKRIEIKNIMDRWYGVKHDYFKVLADDGKIYLLGWHRYLNFWFVEKIIERLGKD